MSVLDLLVAASRPFLPFKAMINGQEFSLLARKLSLAESQKIGELWDEVYAEVRNKYDDAEVDTKAIFARIKRADAKTLAGYVAEADKNDFLPDALAIHDGMSADSPEVQAEVALMVEEKKQELLTLPLDELKTLAYARRAHFYASNQASESTARQTAAYIVHDTDQNKLFPTLEDTAKLEFNDLVSIITEADKALSEKKIDAVPLAPTSVSEKQTPLPDATAEASETSSGS